VSDSEEDLTDLCVGQDDEAVVDEPVAFGVRDVCHAQGSGLQLESERVVHVPLFDLVKEGVFEVEVRSDFVVVVVLGDGHDHCDGGGGEVGQGIGSDVLLPGEIVDGEIELGEELGPTGLAAREVLLGAEVFKSAMVRVDLEVVAQELSAPLAECADDGE